MIERYGQFIEFTAEGGLRTIVRLSAIQMIADTDPNQDEAMIMVANRPMRVFAPLDDLRAALLDGDGRTVHQR